MSFVKNIVGDVRASVVSMITTAMLFFLASIGTAIWRSVKEQPVPWMSLILLCVVGAVLVTIAIIKISKAHKAPVQIAQRKEPQPIIVAIDELKSLLHEGERLVGKFQEDSIKPTFPEIEDWRKRTRDCARQNVLAT